MKGAHHALRIAGVDPELRFAGGETQVMALTRELVRRGHQAELICNPVGQLWERARAEGIVCYPLKIRNAIDIGAALRLRAILSVGGFDVVHFHTSRAHAIAPFVRGCAPVSVVTRRMDYKPNRILAPFLYGRSVDRTIAISSAVADALSDVGVPRTNITIVPSGIDTKYFRPPTAEERARARAALGLNDETIAIGAVGALEKRKGHRYLLRAIASLSGVSVRCFIAGAGSIRAELQTEVENLGCGERVTMLGSVEDARAILWALDIFAMPSVLEGLGVAALEAMACGLPVVASKTGGLDGLIDDTSGIKVPPADADALAAALKGLLNNPELRRQLGMNAMERIAEEYSMTAMAEQTLEVYLECLRDKGRVG
ncbi:MAG TPA: glycosyltransferase family 4 protein [Candidatus Binataceae bacterium]|nr:glycosyltransferase family 4 protein [Candidatus Binataceae bacterium]